MHFALMGDHPDGMGMARALSSSGRHLLATYMGPAAGIDGLGRVGFQPKPIRDLEEVLAEPSIDLVIVASRLDHRPAHLRRALQSGKHVLCVCPVDRTPDIAYEAAMIQKDTRSVLLPLLPLGIHPAFARLAQLIRDPSVMGSLELLESDLAWPDRSIEDREIPAGKIALPVWEVLRTLGGEIEEVSALAAGTGIKPGELLLLSGRFERRGIFRISLLPPQTESSAQFAASGSGGRTELVFPRGFNGPAVLLFEPRKGSANKEAWESWDPWPAMVEVFEKALANRSQAANVETPPDPKAQTRRSRETDVNWQTAIRCLELDDAARRSIERRSVIALEYQEASEEVGFKGTMTLVGCGLLWFILIVVILSYWVPKLGWVIIPLLITFLGMQLFRWILPKADKR
jgi:predicted dehydrogenase